MGWRRSDRWQRPELATPYSLAPDVIEGPLVGAGLVPVHAWVQTPDGNFRVEAIAVSRTSVAVLIRWVDRGRSLEAWVWRAAVKHRRT